MEEGPFIALGVLFFLFLLVFIGPIVMFAGEVFGKDKIKLTGKLLFFIGLATIPMFFLLYLADY